MQPSADLWEKVPGYSSDDEARKVQAMEQTGRVERKPLSYETI